MARPSTAASISVAFRELQDEFRSINQEYFLNKNGRFRPRPPGAVLGTGADYHDSNEAEALLGIERSNHFYRNDWIVGQAINRVVDQILPQDFSLDPDTGDDGLNNELREEWYDWAYDPEQCDLEGQDDFPAMERMGLISAFVAGDYFFQPLDTGQLQTFEAHRCRRAQTKAANIIRGVEVNSKRQRVAFWFTKDDISPLTRLKLVRESERVPAYDAEGFKNVFQLYKRDKKKLRGVGVMAPCVDVIGMHGDLQFAALVKAQVSACYAIIEEVAASVTPPPLPGDPTAVTGTIDYQADGTQDQQIRPGMRYRGKPGVKLQGFSPNVPNAEFFPHVKLLLAIMAANMDIPPFMLLMDAADVGTYGSGRQIVEQARTKFRYYQRLLVHQVRTPVYLWRLRMKAAEDPIFRKRLLKDPRMITRHEFKPPGWKYIDPTKDAKAEAQLADDLLAPRSRLAAWQGFDFKQNANESLDCNAYLLEGAHERAQKIKEKYPDSDVTFRDVLRLSKAASVTVATKPEAEDAEPTRTEKTTDGE